MTLANQNAYFTAYKTLDRTGNVAGHGWARIESNVLRIWSNEDLLLVSDMVKEKVEEELGHAVHSIIMTNIIRLPI